MVCNGVSAIGAIYAMSVLILRRMTKRVLVISEQFSLSRSWQRVMLSVATFEVRKRILTLFLAKPRYIAISILKTYEQFIGGDMHYINKPFFVCAVERHPSPGCELLVLLTFWRRNYFFFNFSTSVYKM